MDLKDLGVSDNDEGSITGTSDNTDDGPSGPGGASGATMGTVDDEAFETLAAEIREVCLILLHTTFQIQCSMLELKICPMLKICSRKSALFFSCDFYRDQQLVFCR